MNKQEDQDNKIKVKKVVKRKIVKPVEPEIKIEKKKSKLIPTLFILVLILSAISGVLVYKVVNTKSSETSKEADTVYNSVAKLYLLTDKEKPKIQKIARDSKENTRYFINAKKGDYLLLFNNQKIAILYRKQINKIIGVKSLVQTSDSPTSVAVLYGGGVLEVMADKIKSISALQIIASADATKKYPKTIVVGNKENPYSLDVAKKLGVTLTDKIPDGEVLPNELKQIGTLIIIGEDNKWKNML